MRIKKESLQLAALAAVSIVLIAFSPQAKEGALHGLEMSETIIIPGLLPLLILFNMISKSTAGNMLQNALAPVTEKVFRLPRATGAAMIFGLIGGYPTGAVLTESLYDNSDIDDATAKRLMRFNVNGGAAFIITAVGTIILKNERAGLLLFASTTLASLLIAFFSSFHYEKVSDSHSGYSALPIAEALNVSTENSIRSVLNISACIILFSALGEAVKYPAVLSPIIEITGGVADNHDAFSLPALAFLIAFSGFCIHFQLFSIIKKINMRYFDFFIWRIVHALLSALLCFLFTKLFPDAAQVFSNYSQSTPIPFSVNFTLSALMILGCAVLIFDIDSRKRKC